MVSTFAEIYFASRYSRSNPFRLIARRAGRNGLDVPAFRELSLFSLTHFRGSLQKYQRSRKSISRPAIPQLTTDGHKPYLEAVEGAFGADIDYAMLVKLYGPAPEGQRRYSPPQFVSAIGKRIEGRPDARHVSTSYVERNNGIIRQHCKRYARLTQAFSKKLENHIYAFALHTMYHNFVKISGAHKMSPAQAAGVDSRLWEIEDMVAMIEAWEAGQEARAA
jgi:hypothetical protein